MFRRAVVVSILATLLSVPAGIGSGASAACAPAHAFHVGTHNVLHGRAFFTRFAGIIGWQEVSDPIHRAKMKHQLGPGYRHYIPRRDSAAAVPVSWKGRYFRYLGSRSVLVHRGFRGVTPERWINVVHLRHRRSGKRIVVVNTHFISEAFKAGASYPRYRRGRWVEHRRALRAVLRGIRHHRPGAAIFVVGDVNRRGYIDLSEERTYPLRRGSWSNPIDQMYAGRPGRGGCVERLSRMRSDHHRWRAKVWLG